MMKRYDELFREIVEILRRDHVGADALGDRFDPRYYNTAVGQAWRDGKLDELLFLRYVSQMLAVTGDRHLRLALCPSEKYTPWSPGFFTRRYGDALYVTAVTGDDRLAPGDRIVKLNGGSPAFHRRALQKNLFFSDEPEREDWNNFLKLAEEMDVERPDGSTERLPLRRWPVVPPPWAPAVTELDRARLIDLRNVPDLEDDALYALLPLVCREETPLDRLLDGEFYVNYSRLNCILKAAGLEGYEGAEEYLAELKSRAGEGLVLTADGDDEVVTPADPKPVVVLTDTWTRDGAETLALAAKRAGAVLIGRPTLGTLGACGDVSLELDERYVLTWPTAAPRSARDEGLVRVEPDIYLPWTPAECGADPVRDAAIQYIEENLT